MVVDNVIITWLSMIVENQGVAHYRLGATFVQYLGVLYTKDSMVGSHDADCIQHSMNVLFTLFRQYVLAASVAKSRTIMLQPGALQQGFLQRPSP